MAAVYLAGVDLGGTKIYAGIAEADGRLLATLKIPTEAEKGPQVVVNRMVESLRLAAEKAGVKMSEIAGLGVGTPGPLDSRAGIVYTTPNLPGWVQVPLADWLSAATGLPVFVENDANVAALGEKYFGAGVGVDNFVYITVSTGIGGGIILNGQIWRGVTDMAGEIGHMVIDVHGPRCNCGRQGCLEALASGPAIVRRALAGLKKHPASAILRLAGGEPQGVTTHHVFQAAREGDQLAQEVVQETAFYLGTGITNIIHILNPELVIVGGGVGKVGEQLLAPVRKVVQEQAFARSQERLEIRQARLGDDAGVLGAILLARGELEMGPRVRS